MLALKHAFEKDWLEQNALRMLFLAENAPDHLQRQFMIYFFERSELKEAAIAKLFETLSSDYKNTIMSTADYFIEKGIEEGEEKKSFEVVKNLLKANKFTIRGCLVF